MEVNLFLPNDFYKFKYFYGQKRVEVKKSTKVLAYYVIKCTKTKENNFSNLNFLGSCDFDEIFFGDFKFLVQDSKIKQINFKDEDNNHRVVKVFNYHESAFSNFNENDYEVESIDKYFFLYLASLLNQQKQKRILHAHPSMLFFKILEKFTTILSIILSPMAMLFQKTAISQHAIMWKKGLNEKRIRNGSILFDVFLGIFICLLLIYYIRNPENYFMNVTESIFNQLRTLLEKLDGSPAGLKLNVQLNNFLHRCFMYHVDLWWNFIIIVEPAIRYLFVPVTIFGIFGFSFQCAMLCDIITVISLHAHCFYIYAAMLYKLELTSLRSLWRIVIGRRLNVLKNRVESQKYSNRQLFLATLFFTTLLFLLPTILIYYVVFAALRMLIYFLTYFLLNLQRVVLKFPMYDYLKWLVGLHSHPSNISFTLISHENHSNIELFQFQLTNFKSPPWSTSPLMKKTEDLYGNPMSINNFFKNLLRGDLMAFSSFE